MNRPRVLIYGGGAVGLGVASCLLKSGVDTTIVARPETATLLRSNGLVRTGIFGDFTALPGSFVPVESLDSLAGRTFDGILVCTKSFDSPSAACDLAAHRQLFGPQTAIVLFQNGWGNAEAFTSLFEPSRVFNARVITGFTRPRPNEVIITVHADAIHIGNLFGGGAGPLAPLADAIAAGGIPTVLTDSIEKDLWAKMLYNCALNPLGAILDVPYGKLAESPHSRAIMDAIINETFAVMDAAGYRTHRDSADGFGTIFYARLVPDTALHRSSTLQDLRAGKRTEIDALTGAVLKLAGQHGLDVPVSRALYEMIRFIEARAEKPSIPWTKK
jgi:2-dehydropantoate 2-reductase